MLNINLNTNIKTKKILKFPKFIYNMISKPLPCIKNSIIIKRLNFVPMIYGRKKLIWFQKMLKNPVIATLFYSSTNNKREWEKYKIFNKPITMKILENSTDKDVEDVLIHNCHRSTKAYLLLINPEYCFLTMTLKIINTSGHYLANPEKLFSESEKIIKNQLNLRNYYKIKNKKDKYFNEICIFLPPRKEVILVQYLTNDFKNIFRYNVKHRWGRPDSCPNKSFRWLVPVQHNKPVLCSQGFKSSMTHYGKFQYAIDLALPEGTNIICPKEGICIDYQDEYWETSKRPSFENKANYLSLLHKDGTVSEYVHLQKNGILVRLGDIVKYGQFIAKSGNTGWSYGPHLHFHVRKSADKNSESIYVRFDNESKQGIKLKQGKFYY